MGGGIGDEEEAVEGEAVGTGVIIALVMGLVGLCATDGSCRSAFISATISSVTALAIQSPCWS